MAVEEYLKLIGAPADPIDNLDALESMGSFGAVDLDANGDLLPDVPVYYAVDELTGLSTSTIFVKPPGATPRSTYATAAALGLVIGDDIDALSIWDVAPLPHPGRWSRLGPDCYPYVPLSFAPPAPDALKSRPESGYVFFNEAFMSRSVYLETYGCQMNVNDSPRTKCTGISRRWLGSGAPCMPCRKPDHEAPRP